MQVQWPSSFTKRELFMSKNARQGRFLIASSGYVQKFMARMGCLWGVEPLNCTKTQTDLSTSLLLISYKYNDSKTGIPTVKVTLLPWTTQLSRQNMLSSTTVDHLGGKSIQLKTTAQENSKVSFCLKAKADGTKLKSCIFSFQEPREKQRSLIRSLKMCAM